MQNDMSKLKIVKDKALLVFKLINQLTITLILFVFYVMVIGLVAVIYWLFFQAKKEEDTFWKEVKLNNSDSYFQSPY